MLKYLHTLIFLIGCSFFATNSYGQTIAGLSYGTTYEQAYKQLKKKFGKPCLAEGKEILGFSDAKHGKISFMFANFHFGEKNGTYLFNGASFLSNYKNYEEAFELYSTICKYLKDKYKGQRFHFQTEGMGDEFFMQCEFGTHPTNPDQFLGKIRLHRGKNQEGKKFYYVNLDFPQV